jgi:hypothetical protein
MCRNLATAAPDRRVLGQFSSTLPQCDEVTGPKVDPWTRESAHQRVAT